MGLRVLFGVVGAVVVVAGFQQAHGATFYILKPDQPVIVKGYDMSCLSTSRTPNFACWRGSPNGPSQTPIATWFYGSRKVFVQSLTRPVVRYSGGEWTTTIGR